MRVADGKRRPEDQAQAILDLYYATQRATTDILTMRVLSVGSNEIDVAVDPLHRFSRRPHRSDAS